MQEQQILELNGLAKATLGVSKVHGVGVFALRNIQKGRNVFADRMPKVYNIPYSSFGKLLPEVKKMILERWPNVMHGERFIYPDARLLSFMNHGYGEDANYDPETDTALRDIQEGEEILENYCIVKDAEKIYPWLDCSKNGRIKTCQDQKGSNIPKKQSGK